MMKSFIANNVTFEDMDDYWLVVFAACSDKSADYLMLQRSYIFDEQDIKHGMDTYYVERDDQTFSCYGGMSTVDLYRDRVIVIFTPEGIKNLGIDELQIQYAISDSDFQGMLERLHLIFAEYNCLHDKTVAHEFNTER